ncbi:MAG: acetyl-CoA C-acetyltransferase [Deltaproteobacteria bacterium]|nr:acetyl-CoA C-acetyltransferase [Deltaproteobacteria bacterium]
MPFDRDIVILSACRTAFGTQGGTLKDIGANDLAVPTARAAVERAGLTVDDIDHVIYGNVLQTSNDAIYGARHVALKAGIPVHVPALTVQRLCGSGFQAVVSAAMEILTGQANAVLCGGTEAMSMAPHVVHGLREGAKFGRPPVMKDLLWECLTDTVTGLAMAQTAEKLGDQYGLKREEVDEVAVASQARWQAANAAGRFADEIVPFVIKGRKGDIEFKVDEHPRATDMATLAKLAPYFKKDGLITAGNASGICDGAASLVVADGKWAEKKGLAPIGRLVGWGVAGCDPSIMGIGPAPAARAAFKQTGLDLADMALVEVNEAFAPQYLAVERELGLDRSITNVNGGAIALGHPLGASGARITGTLLHELRRRKQRYGLGSACIGGGQGIAVIVEAV